MFKISITDYFNKNKVKVTDDGELLTSSSNIPPVEDVGTENRIQFLSEIFGSAGAGLGTINQNVDGSTTPQEFYIQASTSYDIYIMQIIIILADGSPGVTHKSFGAINSLTNGFDLLINESSVDTYIINKAKTGGQLIAQSGFNNPFGTGAESFELINWTENDDAQIISIPLSQWVPGGLRIGRGTTDRVSTFVNDDLTALSELTVRAFGYKNFPN
jgi:hypothetical protein